jgi:NifU-like protein involved in Fe-S cluster formation
MFLVFMLTGIIHTVLWLQVIDHYENPRNVGSLDKTDSNVGTGLVGAPACGDVMKLQVKVDENGKIIDAKFKTFGCGSAIASSSLATEWIKGRKVGHCVAGEKLLRWEGIFHLVESNRIH